MDKPIVVGLAGEALTGKTVTGNGFAPLGAMSTRGNIRWDHTYFAAPLYRMAASLQKISGEHEFDRKHYEVYETLFDLFGRSPLYGAPPWDMLVELTRKICVFPVPPDGEKARTFLQVSGSWCRDININCFVNTTIRKIYMQYRDFCQELDDLIDKVDFEVDPITGNACLGPQFFGAVISDVRYINEAERILQEPNGILIKFVARDDVRQERALMRDGKALSMEQKNHESEQGIHEIPDDWYSAIIDTSDMKVEEQFHNTYTAVLQSLGVDDLCLK